MPATDEKDETNESEVKESKAANGEGELRFLKRGKLLLTRASSQWRSSGREQGRGQAG